MSAYLSALGFVSMLAGVYLIWGVGWMFLLGGLLLFVAGGMGSAREGR